MKDSYSTEIKSIKIPKKSVVSFTKGCWFVFNYSGATLAVQLAFISGRENIYLNGSLIKTVQNYRTTSKHEIPHGDAVIEISIHTDFKSREFRVDFSVDGQQEQTATLKPCIHLGFAQVTVVVVTVAVLAAIDFYTNISETTFKWLFVSTLALIFGLFSLRLQIKQSGISQDLPPNFQTKG